MRIHWSMDTDLLVQPEEKEEDFNPTDDGKSSQKSHLASNQT